MERDRFPMFSALRFLAFPIGDVVVSFVGSVILRSHLVFGRVMLSYLGNSNA